MRVVVFGASGRTGRHVVEQALARGHELVAFARDASRFETGPSVTVVEGDAREASSLSTALDGADAVVSVLALALAEDEPGYSDATKAIVAAADRAGVRRIVVTANNDVFGDAEVTGEFAAHAREHRRNREALRGSTLAWTIVAAPWVVDGPATGAYRSELGASAPGRRITTADLATAALDALEREGWVGQIVGVSD